MKIARAAGPCRKLKKRFGPFSWRCGPHDLRRCSTRVGKRALAREAQIAMRTVNQAHDDPTAVSEDDWKRMVPAAETILARMNVDEENQAKVINWMKRMIAEKGLPWLAEEIGDKSNLVNMILRRRKVPAALVATILEEIRSGD